MVTKFSKDGVQTTLPINVPITKDQDRTAVRDAIYSALNMNTGITDNFVVSKDSASFGAYQLSNLETKAGVSLIGVSIENADSIGGLSFGSGSKCEDDLFFSVFGPPIATSGDFYSISLDKGSDGELLPETFNLPSYVGLSPADIMQQLSSLIDASPYYQSIYEVSRVRISGDVNSEFGVHMFASSTSVLGGSVECNCVPVPAPLPILGVGAFLSYTKRLRHLSKQVRNKDQLF